MGKLKWRHMTVICPLGRRQLLSRTAASDENNDRTRISPTTDQKVRNAVILHATLNGWEAHEGSTLTIIPAAKDELRCIGSGNTGEYRDRVLFLAGNIGLLLTLSP
jgi:hypothetical protein